MLKGSQRILLVAVATVIAIAASNFLLGLFYYHFTDGWLKSSADFLLVSVQTIGIIVGGYWVMRTFGWKEKLEHASRAKQAIKDYVKRYEDIFGAYVHQSDIVDEPPVDFNDDVLPELWKAKGRFFEQFDTCVIPKRLRKKATLIVEESFKRDFVELADKQKTVAKELDEVVDGLNALMPD